MTFAFYDNFTHDDLICKVGPIGETAGTGATIQFNGNESMVACGTRVVALCHHGLITVRHRISRAQLVETIIKKAPDAVQQLGGLDSEEGWPLQLGTTADFPELIDRIFVYAYSVEQAKRSLRGENPLPRLSNKGIA
jgi:hypothetical protein